MALVGVFTRSVTMPTVCHLVVSSASIAILAIAQRIVSVFSSTHRFGLWYADVSTHRFDCVTFPGRAVDPTAPVFPSGSKVTSIGNRRRPHDGGNYARRIQRASACHYSPPRRPLCPGHLPGVGAFRSLVPQVVAPLPRTRRGRLVRPHPGEPSGSPTHPAGTGRDHPRHPATPRGPHRTGRPLSSDRRQCHSGRTESLAAVPAAQPEHH